MKNIGDFSLIKGEMDGIPLVLWDAVQECTEECVIWDKCPYSRKDKCELRKRYLKSVIGSLEKGISNKDEITVMKIGLMLVPLFNQLVTFKLRAYSLGNGQDMFVSSKKIQINPVFKEIRDIIKDINSLLKDLCVDKDVESRSLLNGDSDYYDTMVKSGKVPVS
jgi:hypothetical protein